MAATNRDFLCPPSLQRLNTESAEDRSDFCLKFFLALGGTEALLV